MALASLEYQSSRGNCRSVGKNNYAEYDGSAVHFADWQFRSRLKMARVEDVTETTRPRRDSQAEAGASTGPDLRSDGGADVDGADIPDGTSSQRDDAEERKKRSERSDVMVNIVEALRGDAQRIARDIGIKDLCKEGGLLLLEQRLYEHAFPKMQTEAKELWKAGHETGGTMSRQRGESMGA